MPKPDFSTIDADRVVVHVLFDGDRILGYTPDARPFSHWNTDDADTDGLYLGRHRLGDLTWL